MISSSGKEKFINLGLLWLRLIAGAGIAYHGYGKVFGGHMEMMTQGVAKMGFPMPVVFAWAAALSEFLGGILWMLGLCTRAAAFFVFCTMSVAAFITHSHDPLQVKEIALAYWAIAGTLMLTGSGECGLDRYLCKKGCL